MRWTPSCLLTTGTEADGEMVWSWRPKGSALMPTMLKAHRGGRWQSARFTGESAYKP